MDQFVCLVMAASGIRKGKAIPRISHSVIRVMVFIMVIDRVVPDCDPLHPITRDICLIQNAKQWLLVIRTSHLELYAASNYCGMGWLSE